MDADYVFLCGVMWRKYGWYEAREELLRATESSDPNTKAIASAMLVEAITEDAKLTGDSGI